MAFNLKSIGDIATALTSVKDLASTTSNLVGQIKPNNPAPVKADKPQIAHEDIFPERIEKLIRLVISEGELDEDSIEMLEKAAKREGLDPDEVVFVTKKRLKRQIKSVSIATSPAKELAAALASVDEKFNSAIESIHMGETSGISDFFDSITGGLSGIAISIGKSMFGKDDDDKIMELKIMRDEQRARIISSATLPNNELHVVELLEYVFAQVKANNGDYEEISAWKALHQSAYNRAQMMVAGDPRKEQYIETLKPVKKKFGLF